MNDLVSIVIPVFNRRNLIPFTLDSALKQDYKNKEIIIVDNVSTDGTWEYLVEATSDISIVRLFRNERNEGPLGNWKRCFDLARGKYCKILFSDDLMSSNFISEAIELMEDDVAFSLAPIKIFGDSGDWHHQSKYRHFTEFSTELFLLNSLVRNNYNFPVSPCAALFRTQDLKTSFEQNIDNPLKLNFARFGAGPDLLLYLNTCLKYNKIRILQNNYAWFRAHKGSFSVSNDLMVYYDFVRLRFIRKYRTELEKSFNTIQFLRRLRGMRNNQIFELLSSRISIRSLVQLIAILRKSKL